MPKKRKKKITRLEEEKVSPKSDTCPDCECSLDDCLCDRCLDCGELIKDCICDKQELDEEE